MRLTTFWKLFSNSCDKLRQNNANPLLKIERRKKNSQKLVENGSITDKYTCTGYAVTSVVCDKSVPLGQNGEEEEEKK